VGPEAFVRQQTANAARPDSRPDLARIACPTLVACGRQDALTPLALSEEMARGIPNSTLVVIEDCAHLPTLERPQAATALLRYWLLRP
jgi:pimeloyl-ACP methyl ester carboxylesterase